MTRPDDPRKVKRPSAPPDPAAQQQQAIQTPRPSPVRPKVAPSTTALKEPSGKLKSLNFSDLMFHQKKRSVLVRYLAQSPDVITPLPQGYMEDAIALHQLCIQTYRDILDNEFFIEYDDVSYRVARMHTITGIVYCLRRPMDFLPNVDQLGYKAPLTEMLKWIGRKGSKGLILLAGSTGAGKSTSIYSILKYYADTYGDIIVSIEDPPERRMDRFLGEQTRCAWYQIDVKDYGGYEQALKSTMRYSPRYIFLGEIRDPSVAHWAVRAAVNGHVVLSTIHASSVVSAIYSLVQIASSHAGSSPELARFVLAEGLSLVVCQGLVQDGLQKVQLITESLFLEGDFGIRAKIRTGKLEQLSTDIATQKIAIDRGTTLIKPEAAAVPPANPTEL